MTSLYTVISKAKYTFVLVWGRKIFFCSGSEVMYSGVHAMRFAFR